MGNGVKETSRTKARAVHGRNLSLFGSIPCPTMKWVMFLATTGDAGVEQTEPPSAVGGDATDSRPNASSIGLSAAWGAPR